MSRPIAALLVMLGCLLAAVRLPAAAQPLSAQIANGADAPFKILSCSATLDDESRDIRAVAVTENVTGKRIIAVKLLFTVRNAFDEALDKDTELGDYEMASGESVRGTFSWGFLYAGARIIVCAPFMARFSDGTTWTNDFKSHPVVRRTATPFARRAPTAAPASVPSAQHKAMAARTHPASCRVKLADGRSIDIPWNNLGCTEARKAYAALTHPATCHVKLADGRSIDIPWNNPACTRPKPTASPAVSPPPSRQPTAQPSPSPRPFRTVTIDYEAIGSDGHPDTCFVIENGRPTRTPPWDSEDCEHARGTWAAVPQYMRENLWDRHDGAPENLEDGHPKHCTPVANKSVHYAWQSFSCRNARMKWAVLHPA